MNIKILQWNIWYKERADHVLALLKAVNPDIVCLQELTTECIYNPMVTDISQYLARGLNYRVYYHPAAVWDDDEELKSIGNGIFSRFPMSNERFAFIQKPSPHFDTYENEGRVYVQADISVMGRIFTVGTVHVSYSHKFQITSLKKIEIDNLISLIKERKKNFILTGDLNSTPESYTIKELSRYLKGCGPNYDRNTWSTKPFEYRGFKEYSLNWRLDYAFASYDVNVAAAQVVKTDYSDHLPLLITIEV